MGGVTSYKSKTQSLTTGSSTETEFIAAHSARKVACYLRFLLKDLGYDSLDLHLSISIIFLLYK